MQTLTALSRCSHLYSHDKLLGTCSYQDNWKTFTYVSICQSPSRPSKVCSSYQPETTNKWIACRNSNRPPPDCVRVSLTSQVKRNNKHFLAFLLLRSSVSWHLYLPYTSLLLTDCKTAVTSSILLSSEGRHHITISKNKIGNYICRKGGAGDGWGPPNFNVSPVPLLGSWGLGV